MKLSKEDLLTKVKAIHDEPSEELYVSLLEDISDSMVDVNEELTATIEALTAQVEELKQKYIDRFFTTEEKPEDIPEEKEEVSDEEETDYEDVFEEVEE